MVKHTDAFNLAASALVAVTPSHNNAEVMVEINIPKSTDLPELESPRLISQMVTKEQFQFMAQ